MSSFDVLTLMMELDRDLRVGKLYWTIEDHCVLAVDWWPERQLQSPGYRFSIDQLRTAAFSEKYTAAVAAEFLLKWYRDFKAKPEGSAGG